MINLARQTELVIAQNSLRAPIGSYTPLTAIIPEWDLKQLDTILTVDSLKDDETRKRAIHNRHRTSNTVLGAVVGGLLDASSGDDSIIDGVLLGAAFGAVCTSSPSDPKAQVGLLFSDGSHLSVEVDKSEYTQLQTMAAANQARQEPGSSCAYSERPLAFDEMNYVLSIRAREAFNAGIVTALLCAATPQLIPFMLSITNPDLVIPDIVGTLLLVASCLAFVVTLTRSHSALQKIELFIKGDEELEFYKKLNAGRA